MKVYIAGKITGNGRYREEFAAAERKVRAMGHIPLNPAALPEGMEPADYMRICMAMLDSADAIAIMKNWTESTGARIEFAYAQYVNKKVLKLWMMPDFSPKKDVEPEMDVSSERLEELAAADKAGRVVVLPSNKALTNADRIRAATNQQLAKLLYDSQKEFCRLMYKNLGFDDELNFSEDYSDILAWLNAPSKEAEKALEQEVERQ